MTCLFYTTNGYPYQGHKVSFQTKVYSKRLMATVTLIDTFKLDCFAFRRYGNLLTQKLRWTNIVCEPQKRVGGFFYLKFWKPTFKPEH